MGQLITVYKVGIYTPTPCNKGVSMYFEARYIRQGSGIFDSATSKLGRLRTGRAMSRSTAITRRLVVAAFALAASVFTIGAAAQVHPIVGKWTWTRSVNNCTEVYEYRADGSYDVTSGEEVANGSFEISREPDANRFFVLKGKILKINGARDCSDSGSQPSDYDKPYTVYVIFHRTQPLHLACYEPSLDKCFGPLRRIAP